MNLNLYTPINSLGYGIVGTNIAKSLHKLEVNISLFPIGGINFTDQKDSSILQQLIQNANNFSYTEPCLKIYHEFSLAERIGTGKYFTLSFFELDNLNERRRCHLNSSDVIIAPSEWAKNIMLKNNITKPIKVIPMGVDRDIFKPNTNQKFPTDSYIFINISKAEIRKGHDVLPTIFNQAFNEKNNVKLWMMIDNPFLTEGEIKEWQNYYLSTPLGLTGKIKFINRVNTNHEVAHIMQQADCGIFPSRAEGFNLSALELLSCGKSLIITDYSGHTQYCTNKNSYLINCDKLEQSSDGGKWFGPGTDNEGNWMAFEQPQIDQAVEHMKSAYKKGPILNQEGINTAASLTWTKCAQKIKELIFNTPSKPTSPNIEIRKDYQTKI